MYVVAFFYHGGTPNHRIFPNVFPDLDTAVDAVIYQIKEDHGVELKTLTSDESVGGQLTYYYEHGIYVIGKLFNFNPKGL